MLRRVAQVVRWVLLATGGILITLLPLSCVLVPVVTFNLGECGNLLAITDGTLVVNSVAGWPGRTEARVHQRSAGPGSESRIWPEVQKTRHNNVTIWFPLWLLAFLCLAWPVTSFIIARRRRRGRGFEVTALSGTGAELGQSPEAASNRPPDL